MVGLYVLLLAVVAIFLTLVLVRWSKRRPSAGMERYQPASMPAPPSHS